MRSADELLHEAFTGLLALEVSVVQACRLMGTSRATYYRRRNPHALPEPIPHALRAKPPSTLSQAERANVLTVINTAGYRDLSICQIWTRKVEGKTVTRTLDTTQAEALRPLMDNSRRLRELTTELAALALQQVKDDPAQPNP